MTTNIVQRVRGLVRTIIIPHSQSHNAPMIAKRIQEDPFILYFFAKIRFFIHKDEGAPDIFAIRRTLGILLPLYRACGCQISLILRTERAYCLGCPPHLAFTELAKLFVKFLAVIRLGVGIDGTLCLLT